MQTIQNWIYLYFARVSTDSSGLQPPPRQTIFFHIMLSVRHHVTTARISSRGRVSRSRLSCHSCRQFVAGDLLYLPHTPMLHGERGSRCGLCIASERPHENVCWLGIPKSLQKASTHVLLGTSTSPACVSTPPSSMRYTGSWWTVESSCIATGPINTPRNNAELKGFILLFGGVNAHGCRENYLQKLLTTVSLKASKA